MGLFLIQAVATTAAAQTYTVTNVGSLGGISTGSALNNSGEVVGSSATDSTLDTHAFYWTPSTGIVDMGTVGGNMSEAFGINSLGTIVGTSNQIDNGTGVPFVWTSATGFHELGLNGDAYAVNDRGQIVAIAGNTQPAFVWSKSSGRTYLGTLGGTSTVPHAMNQQGQVVGYSFTAGNAVYHAFLWNKSTGMQDLGTLGGINSYGLGINRYDQVAGWATIPGDSFNYHAFYWTHSKGMLDLGTFGGSISLALGINDAGQVVGSANLTGDAVNHAFLWTENGGLVDLNSLIPSDSGWELNNANAINATGQITGSGVYNGQIEAFLLTPVGASERF
jgi:probable HAF family extracellular repeat protein